MQIEYALAAVAAGAPSVGIKASNGVVLAAEKKHKSILSDESSVTKVEVISKYIGFVYSGMGPDFRIIVAKGRKIAERYFLTYHEQIPTHNLVQQIASSMQQFSHQRQVRPFGVSILVAGWDENKPCLYQCDPSGAYFP
ncbi:hypothetical protein, partial [Salmonella sp. s51228]|uniref:hypothetical protein n=1 Tax=Salmonella sp. s51228 TaxID=3159652 RepID=UPI00397F38A2